MKKILTLLLFLLCTQLVIGISLEYKTIKTESSINNIEVNIYREKLSSLNFLNITSSNNNLRTLIEQSFLNFSKNDISINSNNAILRSVLKQERLNNTYKTNNYYSSNFKLQVKNVTRLIRRIELKRLYQEFLEEFDLKNVKVLFGKTIYDEELFNDTYSGLKNGIVYYQNKPLTKIYESVLLSKKINRTRHIIIQGYSVEGEISALRELLDNPKFYAHTTIIKHIKGIDNIETYDFIHQNESIFNKNLEEYKKVLKKALFGKFENINYTVITKNNISLRLRHIRTLVSDSIKSFSNISFNPLVFAGGLWSDIDSWKTLASKLSDKGYDTWMIEITGGPGQDCDNCINYDYNDLIHDFWPSLIGSIQTLNNNSKIYYIGHSNGARTAISSLETYNNIGKNNTGKIILNNKSLNVSMTKHPVEKMVAVGVPGSFEGQGVSRIFSFIKNNGEKIITNLEKQNISHTQVDKLLLNSFFKQNKSFLLEKISLNLWNNYFNWINSNNDIQIGKDLTINNFLIIKGTALIIHDGIVTTKDENQIFENINSTNKILENVFTIHFGMSENKKIQNFIREFIK